MKHVEHYFFFLISFHTYLFRYRILYYLIVSMGYGLNNVSEFIKHNLE